MPGRRRGIERSPWSWADGGRRRPGEQATVRGPAAGYPSLTPKGNDTPILAFALKDAAATQAKLRQANVTATIIGAERRLRLAVSVFNNHEDIDRVVKALA